MRKKSQLKTVLKKIMKKTVGYKKPAIGIFASHSAKETGAAAKKAGLKTVLIAEKGREDLYTKYNEFLYDEIIILDSFKDLLKRDVQDKLIAMNVIFIPNRSFTSYIDPIDIEKQFHVPMFGSKNLLKIEERSFEKGQYYLLEKAKLRYPKQFKSPQEIDRLVIVKIQQAKNKRERAFFYAESFEDYKKQADYLVEKGVIEKRDLEKARIEEYVLGPRFNADFHAFALKDVFGDFAFVGLSDRIQANLQGYLNLTAIDQLKLKVAVTNQEIGHKAVTMRESKQILLYKAAEAFIKACRDEFPPGMIGMFGLQGAIAYDKNGELEFVIFDVSPRVPGDPIIGPTSPEMRILSLRFGRKIEDPMDLTMMEIERAWMDDRLDEIVT